MLFEMYETYHEKVSPDTYKGALITNRDDLIHAIEDAAGYELANLVGKYLDKVEQQASEAVKKAEVWANDKEAEADSTRDELWELNDSLKHLKDEVRWMMHGKDENAEATYADMYTIYTEIDDLIKF